MQVFEVKDRNKQLIDALLNVWERSVRATHLFLTSEQIDAIKEYVPQALEQVEHLLIAVAEPSEISRIIGTSGHNEPVSQAVTADSDANTQSTTTLDAVGRKDEEGHTAAVLPVRDKTPIAFMGIDNGRLEMLFIGPEERGHGLGKRLLKLGIEQYDVHELTVNEQNPQAVGFYEHMGFKTYKRTELDEEGNPYPLLYMKLR